MGENFFVYGGLLTIIIGRLEGSLMRSGDEQSLGSDGSLFISSVKCS
jgi:hypothetical protein